MRIDAKLFQQVLKLAPVAARATAPILSSVRLSTSGTLLTIQGTDLDLSLTYPMPVLEPDTESWDICVDHAALLKAVASFVKAKAPLTLTYTPAADGGAGALVLVDVRLSALSPDDFPPIPVPSTLVHIPGLLSALRLVEPTISRDESRYNLNQVLLDPANAVAVSTDGHRLTVAATEPWTGPVLNLSRTLVEHALKTRLPVLEDVLLDLAEPQPDEEPRDVQPVIRVALAVGAGYLTSRVQDGTFPNYQQVIPSDPAYATTTWTVLPAAVKDTLARVIGCAEPRQSCTDVAFYQGQVRIMAGEYEQRIDTIAPGTYSGQDQMIGLNARYLKAALEVFPQDQEVTLSIKDEEAPFVLTHGSTTIVIMPMRTGRTIKSLEPETTEPETTETETEQAA